MNAYFRNLFLIFASQVSVLSFCIGNTENASAKVISDWVINAPSMKELRNHFEFDKLNLFLSDRLSFPSDLGFADFKSPKDGFNYLPFVNGVRNISRIKIERRPFNEEIVDHYPLFPQNENSGNEVFSIWQAETVLTPKQEIKESTQIISILPGIDLNFEQPANRFNHSIFSWESCTLLKDVKDEKHLIPNALLDAIVKSNFELFFDQTKIVDEELYAIYLKVLHTKLQHNVVRATSLSISNISTYLMIGGLICLFVSRFTKDSYSD